jgi:hypothetical protein
MVTTYTSEVCNPGYVDERWARQRRHDRWYAHNVWICTGEEDSTLKWWIVQQRAHVGAQHAEAKENNSVPDDEQLHVAVAPFNVVCNRKTLMHAKSECLTSTPSR